MPRIGPIVQWIPTFAEATAGRGTEVSLNVDMNWSYSSMDTHLAEASAGRGTEVSLNVDMNWSYSSMDRTEVS